MGDNALGNTAVMLQFGSVPDNYEEVYLAMARRGARVLALGYKDIGSLSHQQVCGHRTEQTLHCL